MRLLLDREPLDDERIAQLTDEERRGLAVVQRALAHADALGLRASRSYRKLVDRGGEPLVTVVVAAPADRLEPLSWWFPIVGRVPYRGYFDPGSAQRFADALEADGYDTYVRPALLYSTLGWFDDPIPRGLLRLDPILLADTVLHERVHETIFLPGDGSYNEALATFVAHHGTLGMLEGEKDERERARRLFADELRFARLLERLARELSALYERSATREEALSGRARVFERYQGAEFAAIEWETRRFSGFPDAALSNAYLAAQQTYVGDLPCLERQLEELDGDVAALVRLHRDQPGRERLPAGCDGGAESP